jgi:hypothetical protein
VIVWLDLPLVVKLHRLLHRYPALTEKNGTFVLLNIMSREARFAVAKLHVLSIAAISMSVKADKAVG